MSSNPIGDRPHTPSRRVTPSTPIASDDCSQQQQHDNKAQQRGVYSTTQINASSSKNANYVEALHRRLRLEQVKWQRRIPALKHVFNAFNRLPRRIRMCILLVWLFWKVFITVIVLYYMVFPIRLAKSPHNELQQQQTPAKSNQNLDPIPPVKILYIITSLAEFNNGLRATKRGQDRFGEVMLPLLVDGVESLRAAPNAFHVDVYLILHYTLTPERRQEIENRLHPMGVQLDVWDDASPLGYDNSKGGKGKSGRMESNTRALARQHRYVIKDQMHNYDAFLIFEDDMRITKDHVEHFISMSVELDRLRNMAPATLPDVPEDMSDPTKMKFYGPMTETQMERLIPGLIRVEVLLNEETSGAQSKLDPIDLDFQFPLEDKSQQLEGPTALEEERHIDPQICCHVNMEPNIETPKTPEFVDVILWETAVRAFGVRNLPSGSSSLDWVGLLPGPGKKLPKEALIGAYWSGRDGAFEAMDKKGRPSYPTGGMPTLIAQQGGWMATQQQLYRINDGLCMGSFLPPFDYPNYRQDGQESMNVEFWSGGFQLFTGVKGGCNMQRLVSLDPDHFSKHLIYHVANNKQKQLPRNRMIRADNLFGQLNTVKKHAERAQAEAEAEAQAKSLTNKT